MVECSCIRADLVLVHATIIGIGGKLGDALEIGGLMSYAINYADLWRRAARYVDKILQGMKPVYFINIAPL